MFALAAPGEAYAERWGCVTQHKAQEFRKPSDGVCWGGGVCLVTPRSAPFAAVALRFSRWGSRGVGEPSVPADPSTSQEPHPVLPGTGTAG